MILRTASHEISRSLTNLCAVIQQLNMRRVGMPAAHFHTVRLCLEANGTTEECIAYTFNHLRVL